MARRPRTPTAPALPPAPPPSPRDLAKNEQLVRDLQALHFNLEQRCLDRAVVLAHQAAKRQGPLVEHFIELGRRFASASTTAAKPELRLVKGGAA